MNISKSLSLFSILFSILGAKAQLSPPLPFLEHSDPVSALITDYAYKDTISSSNAALIRLPNKKLAYMTKNNGIMQPFFIKAIETGFWDTRYEPDTNYDSVFGDMKTMGANTAYVMLHWEDIETSDNIFDFRFADSVVAAAERHDMKLKWILFLHAQHNGVPSQTPETAWTFHLDDRDAVNYTMQWPKKDNEILKTIKDVVTKGGIRPLHVYGHPEIFYRIRRMLYNLAIHYKESTTVIGVQIGNEEGFSFLDESDYNPITAALYEEWQLKTNKTSYSQFKREAINWWWKQFTSAYHEGDPYKLVSFNLDAGQAEGGDIERQNMTGTSAATYRNGNLDAIGTMFYKNWGYKALLGLDQEYNEGSYNYSLPILIPSEIGIGRFNSTSDYHNFVMHSLERGAQGFGVYAYGEVRKELSDTLTARKTLVDLFKNIQAVEDLIYSGLLGPGAVVCSTPNPSAKISHLNVDGKSTLAMIYFPDSENATQEDEFLEFTLPLNFKADHAGNYIIQVFKEGRLVFNQQMSPKAQESKSITIPETNLNDIYFISIK